MSTIEGCSQTTPRNHPNVAAERGSVFDSDLV